MKSASYPTTAYDQPEEEERQLQPLRMLAFEFCMLFIILMGTAIARYASGWIWVTHAGFAACGLMLFFGYRTLWYRWDGVLAQGLAAMTLVVAAIAWMVYAL